MMVRLIAIPVAIAASALVAYWLVLERATETVCPPHPHVMLAGPYQSQTGRGYCLYWSIDTDIRWATRTLHRLIRAAENRASKLVGVSEGPTIKVVLLPTRQRLAEITGREANGTTLGDATILLVFRDRPNQLAIRHEMMHAVTRTRWPQRPVPAWIQEGLAVFAGGQCSGYTPRGITALLYRLGKLPSLDTVAARFRSLDELEANLTAASFAQFVYSIAGTEGLRILWVDGPERLRQVGGLGPDPEARWLRYVADTTSQELLPTWAAVAQGCRWVAGAPDAA